MLSCGHKNWFQCFQKEIALITSISSPGPSEHNWCNRLLSYGNQIESRATKNFSFAPISQNYKSCHPKCARWSRFNSFSGLKCTSALKTQRSDDDDDNNNNNNNNNNSNNNNDNNCRPFCISRFRREVIYSPSGNSLQIWEHPPLPASHKLTLQPIPSSLPSGQSTLPSQNFVTSTQSVEFTHDLSLDLQVTPAVAEINKAGVQSINQSINQSVNQSINQSVSQSINQSINQSFIQACCSNNWITGSGHETHFEIWQSQNH